MFCMFYYHVFLKWVLNFPVFVTVFTDKCKRTASKSKTICMLFKECFSFNFLFAYITFVSVRNLNFFSIGNGYYAFVTHTISNFLVEFKSLFAVIACISCCFLSNSMTNLFIITAIFKSIFFSWYEFLILIQEICHTLGLILGILSTFFIFIFNCIIIFLTLLCFFSNSLSCTPISTRSREFPHGRYSCGGGRSRG